MTCTHVQPLVERFVDGALEPVIARSIEAHARSCARCAARIDAARSLLAAFSAAPAVPAPQGLFQKVMDGVYRQGLAPSPASGTVTGAAGTGAAAGGVLAARFYRRLGLSLVLTAGVLGVSLLIPRAASISLAGTGGSTVISRQSSIVVKSALDGAGSTVRGILGESPRGGDGR
jgi:anti-sigma factor RsiW